MIGILGGTFDPVHHGHLRVALEIHALLGLVKVHLIPSARPPHRDAPSASPQQRLAMLQAAVADEAALVADDRELHRQGPSYMVDTLRELREEYAPAPLCLLLGMDAFRGLPDWYQWEQLIDLAHLVVVQRPDTSTPMTKAMQQFLRQHQVESPEQLWQHPAGTIFMQQVPALTISATKIRMLIANGGNPRYLLPDKVLEFIQTQRLYQL